MWIAVAAAIVGLWWTSGRVRITPAHRAPPAPRLRLETLDGVEVALSDYRGRVVLLNLWASWCAPCRVEIPTLKKLDAAYRDRGLVVLGVNVESLPSERVAALRRNLGITYPTLVPRDRFTGSLRGQGVLPQTWLIDREGRVRVSHGGLASERSWIRACERLLLERS